MANDTDGGGTKKDSEDPQVALFRSFEESELPKTDYFYVYEVVDDVTEKQACTLPVFDGTNRDVLLFLVSRLRDVAEENDFGPREHWKHFPKALRSSAKDQWKKLYNEIPDNTMETVELFNETLDSFISLYFPAGSLSVVETFREFRDILYGVSELHVYTDHRNLTYATLNSQRVLRWRLFIEEFGPKFHYIKGNDNCLADAFSRVPTKHSTIIQDRLNLPQPTDGFFSIMDDPELLECFLNYPDPAHVQSPLDFQLMQQEQITDLELQAKVFAEPHKFPTQLIDGCQLVCCITSPNQPWRIALPTSMLKDVVEWHHQFLNHIGMSNLFDTIATHFWHPRLKDMVQDVVSTCDTCQRYKATGPAYGELPPREAPIAPWNEVAVDLIGPWKIPMPNGNELSFCALTCIDPVTNLTELKRINNGTSEHITMLFENEWLSRYPRPARCIHDNGGEFTGWPF